MRGLLLSVLGLLCCAAGMAYPVSVLYMRGDYWAIFRDTVGLTVGGIVLVGIVLHAKWVR